MAYRRPPAPPGKRWVYAKWVTRNGKRIYAREYGYSAFCFLVDA
jgi:hypothetical protein